MSASNVNKAANGNQEHKANNDKKLTVTVRRGIIVRNKKVSTVLGFFDTDGKLLFVLNGNPARNGEQSGSIGGQHER